MMRTLRRYLPLGAIAVAAAGCDPGLSERWALEELRILGIRSEPPEVAPGDSIALDSLVVDPLGEGRPVQQVWAVCTPDPARGVPSCGEPERTVPLGIGTSATFTVPGDALDGLSEEDALLGIDLYVFLAAQGDGIDGGPAEDSEAAIKRVRVSTDPVKNRNPRLAWFAPAEAVVEGRRTLLQAVATDDSQEEYLGAFGPDEEVLRFSWYATAGELERGVTLGEGEPSVSDIEWRAERPATLHVVLRDDRGGIDWASYEVTE